MNEWRWLVLVAVALAIASYIWKFRPRRPISWEALEFQKPHFVVVLRPEECGVWPDCIKVQDCDRMSSPFNILAPPEEIPQLNDNDVVWADHNGSGKLIFRVRKKIKTSILD